jgi:NitT/TauT family transport system permease protein
MNHTAVTDPAVANHGNPNHGNTIPLRPVAGPSLRYLDFLKRSRRARLLVFASQFGLLLVFFGLWEVLPRMHVINPMLTSYPSAMWPTFIELMQTGDLLHHTWATVFSTIVGFSLSMVIGLVVGAALWWSDFAYKVLDPFLVVANAMPKIAFVPILYIWLGAEYSIFGMAVSIAVFVTIMIVFAGFRGIDANKIKLANTFGAGLGFLIINGSQIFKMNIVMTAITVLGIISSIMYLAIYYLEAIVSRRYN